MRWRRSLHLSLTVLVCAADSSVKLQVTPAQCARSRDSVRHSAFFALLLFLFKGGLIKGTVIAGKDGEGELVIVTRGGGRGGGIEGRGQEEDLLEDNTDVIG